MGFSRQGYWSGVNCHFLLQRTSWQWNQTWDLALQEDSLPSSYQGKILHPMLILLLLLSHFSYVWFCTAPSLGFSRLEHWSGLPFPSPMHKDEKWKWSRSVTSDSSRPHGLQPTRLLRPWDFPGKSTGVGCHCLLRCLYKCLNVSFIERVFLSF